MVMKAKTIDDFKDKYEINGDDLDVQIQELREYSQKHNWSEQTLLKRENLLQKLHSPLFIKLNNWLISFGLPTETNITKAKKSLDRFVFASVIDVKEKNYHNCKTKSGLIKYLNDFPEKRVNRELAKDEGYKVFLETLKP